MMKGNDNIKLITKRLTLVPCREDVIASFYEKESKFGEHILAHMEQLQEDSSLYGWGVWFVIHNETNAVIGDMGFKGKPNENGVVEIGYGLESIYHNKGYATEGVRELVKWAFTTAAVHKVVAECLVNNIPSQRVLEKAGFNCVSQEGDMLKWELNRC